MSAHRQPRQAPSARLGRLDRIRRRSEFLRVQNEGSRVHTPHFVVMVHANERRRIGITVTRRVAGAVGRNRIKRLVREVFRLDRQLFPANCDVVVVARRGAHRLDYAHVLAELIAARQPMTKAGVDSHRSMVAKS